MKACATEGCTRQVVTRGLCRPCYDAQRQAGVLPMRGTTRKGGRPVGKVRSSPLGEYANDPLRSEREIQELAYKHMYAILANPEANQQEVIALIKVAANFQVDAGSEEMRQGLAEILRVATGGE